MQKGKRLFIIIFTSALLLLSSTTVAVYDNIRRNTSNEKSKSIEYNFKSYFQLMTLSIAKELDPEYEIVTFDAGTPESEINDITAEIYDALNQVRYFFLNDHDFIYHANSKTSGKSVDKNYNRVSPDDNIDNYNFYAKLSYDENGNCTVEGNIVNQSFGVIDPGSLHYMDNYYTVNFGADGEISSTSSIINYKVNQPKNIEIVYILPEVLTSYVSLSGYINSWENFNPFSVTMLVIATLILALLIIIYPIKCVEATNPFYTIKNWKAEINIPLIASLITMFSISAMVVCGNTLNGYFENILFNYGISWSKLIVLASNLIIWIIAYFSIAMGLFQIKYICVSGPINYIKENTLISSLFRYCKRKLDLIADIDLSVSNNKIIMKYILINGLIVILITSFWTFGYVLVIVYCFLLFFYIKSKVRVIQSDYNTLLDATKELGKGNFNEEIQTDLGMFNSLKLEFNKIKNGFEKAVKEEVKSQNMKTELISNVSHDLKTPLTCIKNYIVLLQSENISIEEKKEYLSSLSQYTNRLQTLIEDLFEVSKANSGNIQINPVNLNIVALLEQAYSENEDALKPKDLTVIKKFDVENINLFLDSDKTYRIFENLFTNISKYAMPHTRVYINLKNEDDKVVIEFKNISETQMDFKSDEIAERFVRGDKSRHESGSGLGLAIAKSFTEVQGGKFNIDIDCDLFKVKIEFLKSSPTIITKDTQSIQKLETD